MEIKLPKRWKDAQIGEYLCESGTINPGKLPEVEYTYIDISSVDREKNVIASPQSILGKDAPSRARKLVRKGDIVFATTRPNLKNIAIVTSEYLNPVASTGFCVLRTKERLNGRFLFYYLLTNKLQEDIGPLIRGSQYPAISDKDLLSCSLPVPPIPEQQRIVAKLDELFARIDKAIALVEDNIKNTEHLMASVLNEVFDKNLTHKLGDVLTLQRGFDLPVQERKPGNIPIIGANGVTDYHNEARCIGEGVITGRSGSIGIIHYFDEPHWPLNTALYVKDFKGNLPKYCFYLLRSASDKLKKQAAFAAVPTLDRKNAHEKIFVHLHANKKVQLAVVEYLSKAEVKQKKILEEQKTRLNELKQLKSSLLDSAFKGEL